MTCEECKHFRHEWCWKYGKCPYDEQEKNSEQEEKELKYKVVTYFTDENGKKFQVGDIVTVKFPNGGGWGGCRITKVTNTGFRYCQGAGREKTVQFKNIAEIY